MQRLGSLVLGLAVLGMALCVQPAFAGKKGGKNPPPTGYAVVQSIDYTANIFRLAGDPKDYQFSEATANKDQINIGSLIKVTLKAGSKDEVTSVDISTGKAKIGKKGKKRG